MIRIIAAQSAIGIRTPSYRTQSVRFGSRFFCAFLYGEAHRAGFSWPFLCNGSTNPVRLATHRFVPMAGGNSSTEEALMPEPIKIGYLCNLANDLNAQLEAWNLFLDSVEPDLDSEADVQTHYGVYLMLNHTRQTSSNLYDALKTFAEQSKGKNNV